MAWNSVHISPLFFILFGYCLATCPSFTNIYGEVALENPSNYTGDCPSILVTSEEICLQEFCKIVESNEKCHANAVQYTITEGNSICYILQLHSCKGSADCRFARNTKSKIHVANSIANDDGYKGGICPVMHRCADGQCVDKINRCDDVRDCSDMSDEEGCVKYGTCDPPDYFQCKSDGMCIPVALKCDGVIACTDGSDEMGCTEYFTRRNANTTLMITAISVGVVLSLLLIVLMFACGQKLYTSHFDQRERLRNLRLGSSGADYVVRLLPGEAPFEDTLPPSYNDSILIPSEEPPEYEPQQTLDRLLDIAESSGYVSPHAAKEATQSTESSNALSSRVLSHDSPGPSLLGDKLDSDLMSDLMSDQSTADLFG